MPTESDTETVRVLVSTLVDWLRLAVGTPVVLTVRLLSSSLKEKEGECPDKEPDKDTQSVVDAKPQLMDRLSAPSPPVPV